MCGILGQITENNQRDLVLKALKEIHHRGPDNSSYEIFGNVVLGHNRLSILDLDVRSNQPFSSYDNQLIIIFNGEIYNFQKIKAELIEMGHDFKTTSDTEVVVHAYKQWGIESFKRLHGMFALCILDRTKNKVVLARDRFGEKPLFYYHDQKQGLFFASELKALKILIGGKPEIDSTAILDYLHFGFVPAPKSIYKNLFKVKPGYFLEFSISNNSIVQCQPYYNIQFQKENHRSFEQKKEEFDQIAKQVAKEISISDVSLGAFLSGGVDSSGAVAYLKQSNQKISTFTAGFDVDNYDESIYAELVAKHLNVQNTNKKITYEDFKVAYGKMVKMYDEPHNDFSFIPTYLICKEAAKHHKVMISGDGADEIFCGYPRYHKLKKFEMLQKFKSIGKVISKIASLLPVTSNLRRQAILLEKSGVDFFYYIMCLNFSPDMADQVYGQVLKETASNYTSRSIIDEHLRELGLEKSLIQQQRYLDIKMTLADDMLVKVDRASMANSLEVRPFYLHPLLTDFAFSLSPNELVTSKDDKHFLKKCLEKYLPNSILYRSKMGFTFPLKEQLLKELRPFFDECISYLPDNLINKEGINRLIDLHNKGDRNFIPQLNSLMFLGYWLKLQEEGDE